VSSPPIKTWTATREGESIFETHFSASSLVCSTSTHRQAIDKAAGRLLPDLVFGEQAPPKPSKHNRGGLSSARWNVDKVGKLWVCRQEPLIGKRGLPSCRSEKLVEVHGLTHDLRIARIVPLHRPARLPSIGESRPDTMIGGPDELHDTAVAAHRCLQRVETAENHAMEIRGRVENGVVVLEGGAALPEGAVVSVSYPVSPPAAPHGPGPRVQFPLVPSDRPGSVDLTADRVAELLYDDDLSA
jgi:hypothetical protein